MKKFTALMLAIVLVFSLCACGDAESGTNKTENDEITELAHNAVKLKTIKDYGAEPEITYTKVAEISDNEYKITGKGMYVNDFGEKETVNYTVVVKKDDGYSWEIEKLSLYNPVD